MFGKRVPAEVSGYDEVMVEQNGPQPGDGFLEEEGASQALAGVAPREGPGGGHVTTGTACREVLPPGDSGHGRGRKDLPPGTLRGTALPQRGSGFWPPGRWGRCGEPATWWSRAAAGGDRSPAVSEEETRTQVLRSPGSVPAHGEGQLDALGLALGSGPAGPPASGYGPFCSLPFVLQGAPPSHVTAPTVRGALGTHTGTHTGPHRKQGGLPTVQATCLRL